jgi:hypothetical protein
MTSTLRSVGATVAVMQPYFYPYAGYFRLLAAADTFVVFDDVQFPRRGRVHRCETPGPTGAPQWLTLPLARQDRDVLIKDLVFSPDARAILDQRLARLPWLADARGPLADQVRSHLYGPLGSVLEFLESGLRLVAEALQLPARLVRSSSFALDPSLRGQDRVLALVEALDGRVYVNAPGGRVLYQAQVFRQRGLELKYLVPYEGMIRYLLPALIKSDAATLRNDILRTTGLVV